ncbi:MAG: hypothetical protein MUC49_17225 [Raineya sp.]|nr:hypothetical protein [Raineya sp.]
MKKILIIVILLVTALEIQAQIPTSNFTVNGQTFLVKNLSNTLTVTNAQSPIKSGQVIINEMPDECYNQSVKGYLYRFDYRKSDFIRFYNILREVFPSRRASQLGLKETIMFYFTVGSDGRMLEVEYQFNKNLFITTQELALLDKRLKESMSFTLKPNNICARNGLTAFSYGHGFGPIWEENDRDLQELIDMGADPRN